MAMSAMFTATKTQVLTYLIAICFFSISFLVFVNATISFIITTNLHQKHGVGNAVGTLGFADELVAIVACPVWGLASDYAGVRIVCVSAYIIVGVALFLFVQVRNVFPQLLLVRLLFSVGAAGISTMITATLPSMTRRDSESQYSTHNHFSEDSSTPQPGDEPIKHNDQQRNSVQNTEKPPSTTRSAGFVGLFTGCGALLAVFLFLRFPDILQNAGVSPRSALMDSYYIVGAIAFILSLVCLLGLRRVRENGKPSLIARSLKDDERKEIIRNRSWNLLEAVKLGFQDKSIGLAYVGGLVARASSVGITLFIPLLVNSYFISTGLCDENGRTPVDVKEKCNGAYVLAAELTGVSQLIALIFAPVFGFLAERYKRFNILLLLAAVSGVIGYFCLSGLKSPKPGGIDGSPWIFVIMALIGISQIGAIVCSLGLLGRCILELRGEAKRGTEHHPTLATGDGETSHEHENDDNIINEAVPLLNQKETLNNLEHLKGSIAGIYSFVGGVGILILTKAGGALFDKNTSAPFYMLGSFNVVLLVVGILCGISDLRNIRSTSSN